MQKLSIITVNYNNLNGLHKTIDSVLCQRTKIFEYVIIDGGSTDGSKELIENYNDSITFWVSEPDNGIYHAMNKGILRATGDYLLFLNSGDYLSENAIDSFSKSNFNADLILFNYFDLTSNKTIYTKNVKLNLKYLFKSCPKHQAILFKSSLFTYRIYDEGLKIVADWEFLLYLCMERVVSVVNVSELFVYTDENGVSAKNLDLLNMERQLVLKKYFNHHAIVELNRLYQLELEFNSRFIRFIISIKSKLKILWTRIHHL